MCWLLRHFSITAVDRRDQVRAKGELILRSCSGNRIVLRPRPLTLRQARITTPVKPVSSVPEFGA